MTEIRGIAPEKRWTPTQPSPVLDTLRHLRNALIEIRSSPVLPARQAQHVTAAIAHVAAVVANSEGDHPLTCLDSSNNDDEQQNSRRTEHVDNNTPIGARTLRADLAEMRRNTPKRPPASADELAWQLARSKGNRG